MESSMSLSCGTKSQLGMAQTLAGKLSVALSRVVSNPNLIEDE